jgi:protein arginine kinase activator
MLCQKCQTREAVVHQTVIQNGHKSESHLCAVCAGQAGSVTLPFANLNINQLLAGLLGGGAAAGGVTAPARAEPSCAACGMTYSQFAEAGKLGCSKCYEHLEPHLLPLVRRIHNTTVHTGKVPKRAGGSVQLRRELLQAKEALNRAVAREMFEEAAAIRDRVRSLEARLKAGGEGGAVE